VDNLKILIVDDEKRVRDELAEFLTDCEYRVSQTGLPSEAFDLVQQDEPDIVILDIKLPEMDGLAVLERLKALFADMEIIMITGHGDMQSVIRAMRLGASDYLTKPFRLPEIQAAIERTRKFIALNKKLKAVESDYTLLTKELHAKSETQLIGNSSAIRTVVELMSKVARSDDTTVLISGESGTGKELVARGIHYLSARKARPFFSVNVSAIPDGLFESEFFGHKKGAFTGATEEKTGWFEIAHNSTLFLDEISNLKLNLQAKFLRVLEERKVIKVGSHQETPVNVRVMAATNRDFEQLVRENKFRPDLYHRLNAFEICLSRLRERKEDIPLLLKHFVAFYARKMEKPVTAIHKNVMRLLIDYEFPGNVRELKNMVERALILCDGEMLLPQHFPVLQPQTQQSIAPAEEVFHLELMQKNLIERVLQKTKYNKSQAAKLMKISRQSLDRRIKKFGL